MTSTGGVPYLGSKISLISKSEIRYEGILYTIDTKDSTVALSKVRSFGTEDRPTDRPVAPRDEIYEYIIFRGTDIKDIRVCQPPKPHPTLEGGLPNDPAIVQHSASTTMSSNAAVGSQKPAPIGSGGSSSYGPIGSTTFSQAAPGPPFPSGNVNAQPQNTSPVMDMLNHNSRPSSRASPDNLSAGDSKSPNNLEGRPSQRGRGGNQSGFYRGGRGRGANHQGEHRGGNQGYRGRGGGRGGFQPGRPTANPKKEPLKFEGEYDFDKANEEFKEVLEKLQKSSIESKPENGESDKSATELEEGEVEPATHDESSSPVPENFYDKKKSFFDTISCEATEKSKNQGSRPRQDRNAEFKLNKETFGVAGNRGGRGGYYNRRGYNNYNNGGGYRGNQGQGGQYRGGRGGGQYRGGYQNNRGGGEGGYGGGRGGGGYGRGGYNNQNDGGYNGFNGRFARDGNNFRGGRGRGGYEQRGQRAGGEGGRGNWRNQEN